MFLPGLVMAFPCKLGYLSYGGLLVFSFDIPWSRWTWFRVHLLFSFSSWVSANAGLKLRSGLFCFLFFCDHGVDSGGD